MKIVVLTHTFPLDSSNPTAAFMKEFSDGLAENGHKVFVVTPFDARLNRQGDLFKIITYKYIWPDKLHLLGYSRTMEADITLRKRTFLLIPFMVFFGTIKLIEIIRKEKIDIINAHWIVPNGLMAMMASFLTKVPYTVTIPGTDAYLATKYELIGLIVKLVARNASAIVSNSSINLKKILKLGVDPKIKTLLSYPVDITKFKPIRRDFEALREKYNLKKEDLILLVVGRLVHKKGYDYLIKAVKKLKNTKVKLFVAGEGDLKDRWQNLTRDLNLENNVLFVGNIKRDEIVDYYNFADIMVAPSIIDEEGNVDGGPVASFESMACGKPQIVTNVLGVADEIEDGVNGFIVPQKNVEALRKALDKLIKSKYLREKMGTANVELVRNEISTKSIGKKYTELFQKIIKV